MAPRSESRPRRPHRRRTQAERRQVLADQAASGLDQQSYCRRHGIAPSSFCRWKRELDGEPVRTETQGLFVELEQPAAEAESAVDWDVELELGEGVALRLRAYSGPIRSLIPAQADHPFRAKPIIDSGHSGLRTSGRNSGSEGGSRGRALDLSGGSSSR